VRTRCGVGEESALKLIPPRLAHQWFGDIVTMDWWEALWLNEGFATRMEYIGAEHATPQYEIGRTFQSDALFVAFRADALADVQQLTSPNVDSSSTIEAMFSSISYDKGGSLLHMIDTWIVSIGKGPAANATHTNSAYYEGINKYLVQNQYSTGKPADLWNALANSTQIPQLVEWLTTYETKPGFALVSVESAAPGVLKLKQSRFFQSKESKSRASDADQSISYWIPLSYKCQNCTGRPASAVSRSLQRMQDCSNTSPACAFTGPTWQEAGGDITIGTAADPYDMNTDGWVKLNNDGTAYYRVSYEKQMWSALFAQAALDANLNKTQRARCSGSNATCLSYGDVAQLTDDLFAIVEAADESQIEKGINTSFAVSLMYDLASETSYEFVQPLLYHLANLFSLVIPDVPFASAGKETFYPEPLSCATNFMATGSTDPASSPGDVVASVLNNLLLRLYGDSSNPFAHPTLPPNTGRSVGPLDLQIQVALLSAASQYNVTAVRERAHELYVAGWGNAPPDFQTVIIGSELRWSASYDQDDRDVPDETVYNKLVDQYTVAFQQGTSNASRILGVLSAPYNRVLLQRVLLFANSSAVRVGDRTGARTHPLSPQAALRVCADSRPVGDSVPRHHHARRRQPVRPRPGVQVHH
jgi:hypothetical protein